jgi:hypothetical protein
LLEWISDDDGCWQARHPRRRSPIISPAEPRPGRGGPARRRHVARGGAPLLTCPRRVRGGIATDGYRWRGRVLVAPHPHRARGWAGSPVPPGSRRRAGLDDAAAPVAPRHGRKRQERRRPSIEKFWRQPRPRCGWISTVVVRYDMIRTKMLSTPYSWIHDLSFLMLSSSSVAISTKEKKKKKKGRRG